MRYRYVERNIALGAVYAAVGVVIMLLSCLFSH